MIRRAVAAARTLTWRLVAVVVLLVALTAAIIGTATTVAMRDNLDGRLDHDVRSAMMRGPEGPAGPGPGDDRADDRDGDRDGRDDFGPGQEFGSLRAVIPRQGDPQGLLLSERDGDSWAASTALSTDQLAVLADVPADGRLRTVELPGLGSYRVGVTDVDGGHLVVGLPRSEVDETIADLIGLEVLATLLGLVLAAGAAAVVVRRQLAPLREVAATAHRVADLPLATGDIDLTERVPARLTDERTEVGRVGAALNTLLSHVESSLEARHQSEQQVRQFVADASHELRTPLATIKGYAELARRHPDQGATALAKVEHESVRMTSLVEDLLLLARLDAGRPLDRSPVDVTRLLVEAVSDAQVLAPDHRWQLDLPPEALEVTGDEQRLHQVVTNLLVNARKHTPPGTTVTVAARPGRITVHDDGPGFPAGLAGEAFERFARGDAARTRGEDRGAGLGLALVRAITEAHRGRVSLASRPGDTTIVVELPGLATG